MKSPYTGTLQSVSKVDTEDLILLSATFIVNTISNLAGHSHYFSVEKDLENVEACSGLEEYDNNEPNMSISKL